MKNRNAKTKEKNMEKNLDNIDTINKIGNEINLRLANHFKQWGAGLQFRFIMSSQAYRAKNLGMDVGTLSNKLESMGYIKIMNTPSGQRFVFAGNCPWTTEEMMNWLQEQEMLKETQKEFKKSLKV